LTTSLLKDQSKLHEKDPVKHAALQRAIAYTEYALRDLIYATRTGEMAGEDFKNRIKYIQEQQVAYVLDSLGGKHEINGLFNQPMNRALTIFDDLKRRREGVYSDDRTGNVYWDDPTRKSYDNFVNYVQPEILVKQYGLPANMTVQPKQDEKGDIDPVPIWTNAAAGKAYEIDRGPNGFIVYEIDLKTKATRVLDNKRAQEIQATNEKRNENLAQALSESHSHYKGGEQDPAGGAGKLPEPPKQWTENWLKASRGKTTTDAMKAWNDLQGRDQQDVWKHFNNGVIPNFNQTRNSAEQPNQFGPLP
jgi:hypothetical protein